MRPYLADDQFPALKNDLLLRAARGKFNKLTELQRK
jgi:hypothetical protein